ncbi:MAG: FtsX-like permease family protein [Myxococcota bacterium]|nr:FtsX-like permease family protein [Myxococcota bacterium]
MGNLLVSLRIVFLIAMRNLTSHRVKSLIVGSIMAFGTMLMVVGTSLLDSVEESMEKVVSSSLTGQLQIYSTQGRDELSLFGGLTASRPDIGEIEDFSKLKQLVEPIENVEAIVPMGVTIATGAGGNDIDSTLADLRRAVDANNSVEVKKLEGQIVQLASLLEDEYEYRAKIAADTEKLEQDLEVLQRVQESDFWEDFDLNANARLMYLDTKLAPLAADGKLFFLRLLGTDPQLFKKSFDRFEIDKGQMIPPGKRGVLLSRRAHERFLKHRVARQLDRVKREIEVEGRSLEDDELLQGRVRRLSRQYRRILFQLDVAETARLDKMLRDYLSEDTPEDDLAKLVEKFLLVDSNNFDERYNYFYENIAPMIELYRVNVGETVTIQAFTRRGYLKGMNVKIWGTFQFKGIEDSDLAGVVNLTDMVTFRELYGKMTDAQQAELEELREEVGADVVTRDEAEDALFGGDAELMEEGQPGELTEGFDEFAEVDVLERDERLARAGELTYEQEEIDSGLALNAAVILKDRDRIKETRSAIEAAIAREGLKLRVVNWQEAAGIVGQLITVIRLVLYAAIFIIFLVALVIINNSMVMATMERVSEIGTMRAIGAPRGFILVLFMLETLALGLIAGTLGGLSGALMIEAAGFYGIPAYNEIVRFIFAGPYLYPHVTWGNVLLAAVVIFVVSVIATLYPAIVATRIQPVVAMRGRE